ncbi:MAG: hypothetical protein FD180_4552 [Planctomycetota bacterium]|nr:MAG: hypothetical protein FD180_4552 [Planctomycetota bacterium]
MTGTTDGETASAFHRFRRWTIPLALVAVASASVVAFVHLSRRLAEARAAGAAVAARLDLSERCHDAVEAVRGDLEASIERWSDDEAGRAWLSRCAFPVGTTPSGGAALSSNGPATLLLLARPGTLEGTDPDGAPRFIPIVRIVAWYRAESTESPALASWESEPLVQEAWLAALAVDERRDAVSILIRRGVSLAWNPGASGPRTLDGLTGDVAPEIDGSTTLKGNVRRWCGDAPGAPVLARGLGRPAFYVAFVGAKNAEIHVTMEVKVDGRDAIRREIIATASSR